jgi:DNA (cytosine-5)-methyltransferase 1
MFRVCKAVRPQFIVAENVPGIISMELDNMLADLEAENYTCWPPFVIPACAVGADHRRERVWIVAHANGNRRETILQGNKANGHPKGRPSDKCYSHLVTSEQFEKSFAEPLLLRSTDGLPPTMDIMNALRATGNAIVPQIAYTIFRQIEIFLK